MGKKKFVENESKKKFVDRIDEKYVDQNNSGNNREAIRQNLTSILQRCLNAHHKKVTVAYYNTIVL